VVKLTQAHLVDRDVLRRKATLIEHLARLDAAVVGPVPVQGSPVRSLGEWLVPGLHQSMRDLPTVDIPRAASLEVDTSRRWDSTDSDQLLHGDFAASNLLQTPDGIRIFDFDDCGYGPVEFDIANSLYMVMFDSWVNDRSDARYQEFKAYFVNGYTRSTGRG
jgi:hypothetical protein